MGGTSRWLRAHPSSLKPGLTIPCWRRKSTQSAPRGTPRCPRLVVSPTARSHRVRRRIVSWPTKRKLRRGDAHQPELPYSGLRYFCMVFIFGFTEEFTNPSAQLLPTPPAAPPQSSIPRTCSDANPFAGAAPLGPCSSGPIAAPTQGWGSRGGVPGAPNLGLATLSVHPPAQPWRRLVTGSGP